MDDKTAKEFAADLLQPTRPVNSVEREMLASVPGLVYDMVRPQLHALGMDSYSEWAGRREFCLGYITGFALGICERARVRRVAAIAVTGAQARISQALGTPEPSVDDLAGWLATRRVGFDKALELGRQDGLEQTDGVASVRLLRAFQPGETLPSTESVSTPKILSSPTGWPWAKRAIAYATHHTSQLLFIAGVGIVAWPLYQDWAKQHAIEKAAEEQKAAELSVARDASVAASLIFSAVKNCATVGQNDVMECSVNKGLLPLELAAAALAKTAIEHKLNYDASCAKVYTQQQCRDLINRAYHIEQASSAR